MSLRAFLVPKEIADLAFDVLELKTESDKFGRLDEVWEAYQKHGLGSGAKPLLIGPMEYRSYEKRQAFATRVEGLAGFFGFRSWTLPLDFAGFNHRNFGGPAADRKKVREKKKNHGGDHTK